MTIRSGASANTGVADAPRFVIGLTGPIASGKSTIAEMLRRRGAMVIDADRVYRSLLTPGSPVWREIVELFGSSVLQPDQEIDRAKLGDMVFANPGALADLERITHPAVVSEIRRQIAEAPAGFIVVEAVKLTQAGLLEDVESLWFVTADPEVRLRRLIARGGLDESQARARISASIDLLDPEVSTDVTIDNSGNVSATELAVADAWDQIDRNFSAPSRFPKSV